MSILKTISRIRALFRAVDIKPYILLLSGFCSCVAGGFEAINVAVLVPFTRGFIAEDFSYAESLPVLRDIIPGVASHFASKNTAVFVLLIGLLLASALLRHAFTFTGRVLTCHFARQFSNSLRKTIFERYLSFGKQYFDRVSVGVLNETLLLFTHVIGERMRQTDTFLPHIFMLLTYFCAMCVISWKTTILVIMLFPIMNYIMKQGLQKAGNLSTFYASCWSKMGGTMANTLSCISLIKLYGTDTSEKRHFKSVSDKIAELQFKIDKIENVLMPLPEIMLLVLIVLLTSVITFTGVRKPGEMANFFVFFYILKRAQGSLTMILGNWVGFATVGGPIEKVLAVFDDQDKVFVPEGKIAFAGLKKEITVSHLSFSYVPNRQILNDVSLTIEKGKVTAIVGATGSGKTTLVNLVLRFYDCPPGAIMIDGVDINNFTLKSLLAHFAYVSQDMQLFNDTIRNNITYGMQETISEERLINAAKKTHLYELIKRLPDGFETVVGDRGVQLSGGEKQMLAMARALLKGVELLVLDEATSALDSKTEHLLQEAIHEMSLDRTVIVIAHRLATIKNASKIITVEGGRIVEEGAFAELIARKGKFYEYWTTDREDSTQEDRTASQVKALLAQSQSQQDDLLRQRLAAYALEMEVHSTLDMQALRTDRDAAKKMALVAECTLAEFQAQQQDLLGKMLAAYAKAMEARSEPNSSKPARR